MSGKLDYRHGRRRTPGWIPPDSVKKRKSVATRQAQSEADRQARRTDDLVRYMLLMQEATTG